MNREMLILALQKYYGEAIVGQTNGIPIDDMENPKITAIAKKTLKESNGNLSDQQREALDEIKTNIKYTKHKSSKEAKEKSSHH